MSADRAARVVDASGPVTDRVPTIDWASLERATVDRPAAVAADQAGDRVGDEQADLTAIHLDGPADRLAPGAALDPARTRVAVAELHPDRLTPGTPAQDDRLAAAIAEDPRPEYWIPHVNPGFVGDALAGRAGRTENCADSARAFQDVLDGRPHTAAAIDERGLPCADRESGMGEDLQYTEQWAGRRSEATSWAEIEAAVRDRHGSAIVFAFGSGEGHAFNAYTDDAGNVRWGDAQSGDTGPWPPEHLRAAFPTTRAIVFDQGGA